MQRDGSSWAVINSAWIKGLLGQSWSAEGLNSKKWEARRTLGCLKGDQQMGLGVSLTHSGVIPSFEREMPLKENAPV